MTSRRAFLGSATVLAASLATPRIAFPQAAKFTGKLSHPENPTQPRHKGLEKVVSLVRERTKGEVELTIFPSGQLGSQRQMIEGTQFGAIECTMLPSANMAGFNPLVAVLDIPYLYPSDRALAQRLRGGPFGKALLESFDSRGFHAAAMWANGRKVMTSNKPLTNVAAFNGQKFRVIDSKVLMEQFAAVGASAIAINFGELYVALQTGLVDGQENPIDTINTMKFFEVQKYLVVTEHGLLEDIALFNTAWWNKLPPEHRETIRQAFAEVGPDVEKLKEAAQQASLENIKKSKINVRVADEAERRQLRETMAPRARAAFLERGGPEGRKILDLYDSEVKKLGI